MYNFVDVNENSEVVVLPSEALQINGEFIENLIDGYRTLNVQGREAMSPEVDTFTTGIRDGSRIKNKRYPERYIVVTYQIKADSNEAFREAYNKLAGILNVQDAELIFNDEPDKFFVGTPCAIGAVEPGRNAVVGEFEIVCADPFKYSVIEYEAEPSLDDSSILIDYGGTYKAFPTLEADFYNEEEVAKDGVTSGELTGAGDCGFVAFFNEDKKIIQLGDADEVDKETFAKAQTLINQTFMGSTAWGTTAKSLWAVNNGHLQSNTVQVGSVAMAPAGNDTESTASGELLTAKSTASTPTIKYKVSAKASANKNGTVNANFAITASLGSSSSYFLSGYVLKASIYVGGAWHDVTLKKSSDQWRGLTGHTVSLPVTVTGVASDATALTGIKFKVERTDGLGTAGRLSETACKNLSIGKAGTTSEDYFLTAASYGTDSAHWHGPSITRQVGADAAGNVGAKNFTLTYKQKMCIGNGSGDTKQMGGFQMHILDVNGKNIAGVRVYKNTTGKSGKLVFYVNGKIVNTTDIDLHHDNYYFGSSVDSVQTTTVTKTGNQITFAVGGYKRQFVEDSLAETVARKVTFAFEQYPGSKFLSYNGLYWAKFVKNNCDTYKDIPNKFSANDVVEADCKNGEIYLNGIPSPELGALGNDWEGFYLTPGLNQIGISYSNWVADEYAPTFKVRYREVFL